MINDLSNSADIIAKIRVTPHDITTYIASSDTAL